MKDVEDTDTTELGEAGNEEETASNEVVVDANIYAILLEVMTRHEDDINEQQKSIRAFAGAMYRPTFPRRLFRALFPSVEAARRIR